MSKDINKIIDTVISSLREKNPTVYRDEPIIKRAGGLSNFTPDRIHEMRKICGREDYDFYTRLDSRVFYEQAKFMADYDDDYDYQGTFLMYFPTYEKMTVPELRGYFTWRAKVKKGIIEKTQTSFAYLYIYELLMCIHGTPEECYRRLTEFEAAYTGFEPRLLFYTYRWIFDFIVYYGLAREYLKEYLKDSLDGDIDILADYENSTDTSLARALAALSSYGVEKSRFIKDNREDFDIVLCRAYRRICGHYEKTNGKSRKRTFCAKLFGFKTECVYQMFSSAVFYDHKKYSSYSYEISGAYKFKCTSRLWLCERYFGAARRNVELGNILRIIDFTMRRETDYKKQLKETVAPKYIGDIIEKTVKEYYAEKKEAAKRAALSEVTVDLSRLSSIRAAADITREKLTAFEDADENEPSLPEEKAEAMLEKALSETPRESETPPCSLDKDEYALLAALLDGRDGAGALAASGRLLSVVAESINEKLYDDFADTVIIFEGETPVLVEDYIEELKGMI